MKGGYPPIPVRRRGLFRTSVFRDYVSGITRGGVWGNQLGRIEALGTLNRIG